MKPKIIALFFTLTIILSLATSCASTNQEQDGNNRENATEITETDTVITGVFPRERIAWYKFTPPIDSKYYFYSFDSDVRDFLITDTNGEAIRAVSGAVILQGGKTYSIEVRAEGIIGATLEYAFTIINLASMEAATPFAVTFENLYSGIELSGTVSDKATYYTFTVPQDARYSFTPSESSSDVYAVSFKMRTLYGEEPLNREFMRFSINSNDCDMEVGTNPAKHYLAVFPKSPENIGGEYNMTFAKSDVYGLTIYSEAGKTLYESQVPYLLRGMIPGVISLIILALIVFPYNRFIIRRHGYRIIGFPYLTFMLGVIGALLLIESGILPYHLSETLPLVLLLPGLIWMFVLSIVKSNIGFAFLNTVFMIVMLAIFFLTLWSLIFLLLFVIMGLMPLVSGFATGGGGGGGQKRAPDGSLLDGGVRICVCGRRKGAMEYTCTCGSNLNRK